MRNSLYSQPYKYLKINLLFLLLLFLFGNLHDVNGADAIWKPETIMQMKTISDVDVSPDGNEVVYSVTEAKIENEMNAYVTQIWKGKVADVHSHVQFTIGEKSSSYPRWSPDGRWIAFLSQRKGVKNLFLISPEGGEAVQLTSMQNSVETFRWSPDSTSIAFVAKNDPQPSSQKNAGLSDEVEKYTRRNVSQLFVIHAQPHLQTPTQLTTTDYNVVGEVDFHTILEAFDWSPDCQKIAFTYYPGVDLDSRWKDSQIAIVDVQSKTIEQLPMLAPHQSIPRFSPDGENVAFLKSDPQSSYCLTRHVTLYSLNTHQFRELQTTPDEGPFLLGPSILGWSSDGSSVLFLEPFRTKFALWSIPIHGDEIVRIDDGRWTFNNPLLSSNRKWLGIPLETSDVAPEAYVTPSFDFSPRKASNVNEHLKKWNMAQTKVIHWKSSDGTEIEGLMTLPKGYCAGTRYPFLLVVHGGPMGVYSENYLGGYPIYPLAAFADAGFIILRANPRGSCGYGRDFRYAVRSDWGGIDFQDLMSGVDTLIDEGFVDANRMGVMGWSYGGYMTAWMISQTSRFSAASMGAGISNLTSMTGTTDLHHFLSDYLGHEIWEDPTLYLQRSPIFYTDQISTPLLIQHGEGDLRVPFSQAIEFYNALRKAQKPVTFAAYPRSTHRIFEPKLHLDALQRNFDWFVENIKNKNSEN